MKRAMGELKDLRGKIAAKDKEIAANGAKTKKMMAMFKDMKTRHAEDMAALKLKHEG